MADSVNRITQGDYRALLMKQRIERTHPSTSSDDVTNANAQTSPDLSKEKTSDPDDNSIEEMFQDEHRELRISTDPSTMAPVAQIRQYESKKLIRRFTPERVFLFNQKLIVDRKGYIIRVKV